MLIIDNGKKSNTRIIHTLHKVFPAESISKCTPETLNTASIKPGTQIVVCNKSSILSGIVDLKALASIPSIKGIIVICRPNEPLIEMAKNICLLSGLEKIETIQANCSLEEAQTKIDLIIKNNAFTKPEKPILLIEDINHALDEDLFNIAYQPQYDLNSGKLVSVEALVRLENHPPFTRYPDEFMHIIDKHNLHMDMFKKVIDISIRDISELDDDVSLSINIDQENLDNEGLYDLIIDKLEEYAFPANRLTLEITEKQIYSNTITSLSNLSRLRMLGVGLAIDDFGTGHGTLSQLAQLPFTELKIDKDFIINIRSSYTYMQLSNSCISLAQSLGLRCVAEGIENEATLNYLRENGVDYGQGYFLSKPINFLELKSLLLKSAKSNFSTNKSKAKTILFIDRCFMRTNAFKKSLRKHNVDLISSFTVNGAIKKINENKISNVFIDSKEFSRFKHVMDTIQSTSNVAILADEPLIDTDYPLISVLKRDMSTCVTTLSILDHIRKNEILKSEQMLFDSLSNREKRVSELLLNGFSNKQIAYELNINEKTVNTYKSRTLYKLGAKSTAELLILLERLIKSSNITA